MKKEWARKCGTCGVCRGRYMVQGTVLSKHGYQRPGDGALYGDCFGSRSIAWEKSPDAAKDYLAMLVRQLTSVREGLAAIREGRVTEIEVCAGSEMRGWERVSKWVKIGPEDSRFARALALQQVELENEERDLSEKIAYREADIAAWVERPLPDAMVAPKVMVAEYNFKEAYWRAAAADSGRTVSRGRTLAGVVADAKKTGWTFAEGAEIPAEIDMRAYYETMAREGKRGKSPTRYVDKLVPDGAVAELVLEAVKLLSEEEQGAFARMHQRDVTAAVTQAGYHFEDLSVEKLRASLAAAITRLAGKAAA